MTWSEFFIFPGFYYTADLAHRDTDGDYKLIGRKGDAIRTPSGDWLSVTEIESVMVGSASNGQYLSLSSYIVGKI